ncbi:MAG: S9 family peptidase [Gammaproteobacteria bacterium]|nr:S9 family peptidase [Gammaproteobacteria bacterium]
MFNTSPLRSYQFFICLLIPSIVYVAHANDEVAIPPNIVVHNIPALSAKLATRLERYTNTRGAGLYGWQGDSLLVGTRFANAEQMHRVRDAMGYREQLTFLKEPLADVAIPDAGAKNKVVISWDVGGSEFDQLFLFDLNNGDSKMVSDGKSLYAYVTWAPDEQSFAYVTTQRNGRNWDTHIQSLDGSINKVLETQTGFWIPLGWSADGRKLLMKNRVSVNESSIHELDVVTKQLRPLFGHDNKMSVGPAAYDGRGGVYFTSDHDSQYLRLQYYQLDSGKIEVITADVDWNVEGFTLSVDKSKLAYSINQGGLSKISAMALPSRKSIRMAKLPQGIVTGLVFSPDSKKLGISINSATSPQDVYVADLRRRKLTRWTQSEVGGLDSQKFVEPSLIDYVSFDARKIPAFVYTPNTPGPHAVVIYIHGGPESQYRPYFSTLVQSYVNEMNVVVIAPNVRGSNGYGKNYLRLDNGRLREDSVKDIGALLDWINGKTQFRSDRVAVIGGSYGGYMVLASMVHYPDRLAAAVDTVGISNFVTFLENTQAYRQDMRRVEYGDERDPSMRAFLEKISPLNHVEKMTTPILISQGANDPRVPASESEQIRVALEAAGVPVWYVLAKDEGHGFRKKVNRDYDRTAKFAFLEAYLVEAFPVNEIEASPVNEIEAHPAKE